MKSIQCFRLFSCLSFLISIVSCGAPQRIQHENVSGLPIIFPTPAKVIYQDRLVPLGKWDVKLPEGCSEEIKGAVNEACRELESGAGPKWQLVLKYDKEKSEQAYDLVVTDHNVIATASSDEGFFYALQSLRQLKGVAEYSTSIRLAEVHDKPGFKIRGFIGGAVPSELLKLLAHYKMNLLQFTGGRGDLDEKRQKYYRGLVKLCSSNFIRFLSHEGYKGEFGKKLEFTEEGFKDLVEYFNVRFDLGARAFTVAFDDMKLKGKGLGKSWGEDHAKSCRLVYDAMKKRDPSCMIFFCPVPYSGTQSTKLNHSDLEEGIDYLKAVGKTLPPDVFVYWTGMGTFSKVINGAYSDEFGSLIGRKPFIWDNDAIFWCNEFRPLSGRSNDLQVHASGYVANLASHLSMWYLPRLGPIILTIADYLWNPAAYDDKTALERVFQHLGGPKWKELKRAWEIIREAKYEGVPVYQSEIDRLVKSLAGTIRPAVFQEHFLKHLKDM